METENVDFPGGPVNKNLPANAGDTILILVPEDPAGQLNLCTTTTEATQPRAPFPQRGHHSEKPAHCSEEQPTLTTTRENPQEATKTQHSQK